MVTSAQQKTLSDLIVDYLGYLGIEYVFGIPGGHISSLYEALARSEKKGGPRAILSRHETGAASMADGYARETGKIGVCCATTGPGATNLITGVASAYAEHIPLLVITAQTSLAYFSWGAFQESSPDTIDTVGMMHYCTRYNTLVTHPNQLERKLVAALNAAFQNPPGPVHLSIPVDIFRSPLSAELYSYPIQTATQSFMDITALEKLWSILSEVLNKHRRLILFVGRDCAGATQDIMTFAELTHSPIITTQEGKSWINPYHPLARGVFGFAGHTTARRALMDDSVEVILAVGTTLGQWATSGWDSAILNKKLVHIHPSGIYFSRSPMAQLHVQGTIKTIFKELVARLETRLYHAQLELPQKVTVEMDYTHHYAPSHLDIKNPEKYVLDTQQFISPPRLIRELLQHLPPETRFIVDTSNWLAWSIHYLFSYRPENYRLSVGTAAMGWGIGNAVGTAFGTPKTPVVCLTGDGCFLMNGQEITVAVAEQLPVIFIVLNDRSYGMVKHRHRQTGTEPLEFAIPPVDFSLMAKAVGAKSYVLRCTEDLNQLDYQAMCAHGPTLLDVHVDPEEVPPLEMI